MADLKFLHELAAETEVLAYGQTVEIGGRMSDVSGGKYCCRTITITVSVGTEATALFAAGTPVTITSHTAGWTALEAKRGKQNGQIDVSLQYKGGKAVLTEPVQFTLSGKINNTSGTAEVAFEDEYSAADMEGWEFEESEHDFTKSVVPFYLKNFMAAKPDNPRSSCTEFNAMTPIRFSWQGSGTSYRVYKAGESNPIYTGQDTFCECESGVFRDTTFILEATLSGGEQRTENAKDGLAYKVLYDTITITVPDPHLNKLEVSGILTVQDDLRVYGQVVAPQGGNFEGNSKISNATLDGDTNMDAVKIGQNLNGVNANVKMFTKAKKIDFKITDGVKAFTFSSDGILYGTMGFNAGEESNWGAISIAPGNTPTVWEETFSTKINDTAGKVVELTKTANIYAPVIAGDLVLLRVEMKGAHKDVECFDWYYIPFGTGEIQAAKG